MIDITIKLPMKRAEELIRSALYVSDQDDSYSKDMMVGKLVGMVDAMRDLGLIDKAEHWELCQKYYSLAVKNGRKERSML